MKFIAYDTETTGLRPYNGDRMFAFSTAWIDDAGEIQSRVYRIDDKSEDKKYALQVLDDLWSDDNICPVMHNSKFDVVMTEFALGRDLKERMFHDTMLMSNILRNNMFSHGLKELAYSLAGISTDDEKEVKRLLRRYKTYDQVPVEAMNRYQQLDAERTITLFEFFCQKLAESDPSKADVYEWERRLAMTTARMESRGIMIHRQRCTELVADLEAWAQEALDKMRDLMGDPEYSPLKKNAASDMLFDVCGLDPVSLTSGGQNCTDKDVLLELRGKHEAVDWLLQYRSYTKGIANIQSYLDLADEHDVIHPSINTLGAKATGRESCQNPNLQNVAKDKGVLKTPYPIPARRSFRPRPGFVNFHIDYAGIEMRIAVDYSGEQELIDIMHAGGDVHAPGAEMFYEDEWFNETDKDIRKALRNATKNGNFGIIYGAGLARTAETLLRPIDVIAPRYARYKSRFPKLLGLNDTISAQVKRHGWIETKFGRRLYVPRDKAYVGTNYMIQGTAADLLKRAQVLVDEYLRKELDHAARVLLPIHDEIIVEWPRKLLDVAQYHFARIRELMITFPQIKVPLEIEVDVTTRDWATKHPYPLHKEEHDGEKKEQPVEQDPTGGSDGRRAPARRNRRTVR